MRFFQLDVFTNAPLAGNPLAVFPNAQGLSDSLMQRLAREMNLSETTFVLPSEAADAKLRIFTPAAEIPLAGHPVIGTWWLLAELGRVANAPADGTITVYQETGRGTLPVEISFTDGRPSQVLMTQAAPEFGMTVEDRAALARVLGGDAELLAERPAPEVVSTALPQLMAAVRSREALAALPSGGGSDLSALLRQYGTDCVMLYVLDTGGAVPTAHCRMFAPGLGVPEDPATGSAAGALGAHLLRCGLVEPVGGTATIRVLQGLEMGRPSEITVSVEGSPEQITRVRVGGTAVRIMEGEVTL